MNSTKFIVITVGLLAVIVGILFYNKSQMAARSKSDLAATVPVTVTTIRQEHISSTQSHVGTITANNDVAIISETQGRITAASAEVGQYKTAGSVLVNVDDELKKASLAAAEVNHEKAKRDLERFEHLAKQEAATDQQVEAARLAYKAAESQYVVARREYNDTKITTPISGIVTSRPVDVGMYVQRGMQVANVVDVSKLKVKINVAEDDVFRLSAGDTAEVTTEAYPEIFLGTVKTISTKADDAHTYPVEINLANSKEYPLKSGMFCRVNFPSLANKDGMTIPREALVGSLRKPQVYLVDGTVARLRDIIVGAEVDTRLIVLRGLSEGETLVVNGQNNLKDGIGVTVVR